MYYPLLISFATLMLISGTSLQADDVTCESEMTKLMTSIEDAARSMNLEGSATEFQRRRIFFNYRGKLDHLYQDCQGRLVPKGIKQAIDEMRGGNSETVLSLIGQSKEEAKQYFKRLGKRTDSSQDDSTFEDDSLSPDELSLSETELTQEVIDQLDEGNHINQREIVPLPRACRMDLQLDESQEFSSRSPRLTTHQPKILKRESGNFSFPLSHIHEEFLKVVLSAGDLDELDHHGQSKRGVHEKIISKLPKKVSFGDEILPLDRRTIWKEYDANAYDGPVTQDFLDRLDSLATAVIKYMSQNGVNSENDDLVKKINEIKVKYQTLVEKHASLNLAKVTQEISQSRIDHFEIQSERARVLMKQFLLEAIETLNRKKSKSVKKITLDQIRISENEVVLESGRNNLVHVYQVPLVNQDTKKTKFISAQAPISRKMSVQPSTVRDQYGLANAVGTSFHQQNESGEVKTLFSAYRHSSYSPIGINDPTIRFKGALNNMEEMLSKVVDDTYRVNKECPKKIKLSSLMLLTPFKMDQWVMGNESETNQVAESYLASRMLEGQKIKSEHCKKVTVDLSLMNLGSNKMDVYVKKTGADSGILKGINAKGYLDFEKDFRSNLDDIRSELESIHLNPDQKKILDKILEDSTFLSQELPKDEKQIQQNLIQQKLALKDQYRELRKLYSESDLENREQRKQLEQMQKKVAREEEKFKKQQAKLFDQYKKDYLKKEMGIRFIEDRLLAKSKELLGLVKKNPKLSELIEKQADLVRLVGDARNVYLKGLNEQWQHKFDFQKNYLLANYLMKNNVEFFCKSAEDRTGRVNNKVEEALIYRQTYGEFPSIDGRKNPQTQEVMKTIATHVHFGSTARDANGMNAPGARGMQISEDDDIGILGKMDDQIAKFAKGVYAPLSSKEKSLLKSMQK